MRHVVTISGKDSAAAALVQIARAPDLPYEFVFCDVKMELPETYAWLNTLETTLGITIKRIGRSLMDVIEQHNMLPSSQRRFCTRDAKIRPANKFIGLEPTTQYFGIRADEADRHAGFAASGKHNITPVYPLIEMGIDLPAVYTILGNRGVLPPDFHWERLFHEVYGRVDPAGRDLIACMKPWERAFLFSWRSRANCYMCFYQRRYEWVGLLEHHPDLFNEAQRIEVDYGSPPPREQFFFWIPGTPLAEIKRRAQEIFEKRVKDVSKSIMARLQGTLWQVEDDPLTVTSCGLFCGK